MERMRIPFSIESEQNILVDEDIGKIILILKTENILLKFLSIWMILKLPMSSTLT